MKSFIRAMTARGRPSGGNMKTLFEPSKVLDRGGKPTVRELLSGLAFNPTDGTIRLNGDRIVMQRAAVGVELRRELIRLLGPQETRVFLMRLGYFSGLADARFVRRNWPSLDPGDAFTAGTRLHTFSGVVRVETVYNDFDFRRKRFAGEFIWNDSVEAAEFVRLGLKAAEPVCWTQLGYASGYASEFLDTPIIYKEVECAAMGHACCRVVGKPAEGWGPDDPQVALFCERVIVRQDGAQPVQAGAATARTPAQGLSDLDRRILAPVVDRLESFAPMRLPVLIMGLPGTGRSRAARFLHDACGRRGDLRQVFGGQVDHDLCAEITRRNKGGRRGGAETIMIDGAENIPAEVQAHFVRAVEEGVVAGGPRILALAGFDPVAAGGEASAIPPDLWYALSALTVRMPALAEREDKSALAAAVMPVLAARMGLPPRPIDQRAAEAFDSADWPGNLSQMRAVLGALLAAGRGDEPVLPAEIATELLRTRHHMSPPSAPRSDVRALLDRIFDEGGMSLQDFERSAYAAAVDRAGGNLSAAARLLGLTRPQLAYRLGAQDDRA
jgi:hypothetical protein